MELSKKRKSILVQLPKHIDKRLDFKEMIKMHWESHGFVGAESIIHQRVVDEIGEENIPEFLRDWKLLNFDTDQKGSFILENLKLNSPDNFYFEENNEVIYIDSEEELVSCNSFDPLAHINYFLPVTPEEKIVIAVLDSGVDYTHNNLRNSLWENQDRPGSYGFNLIDIDDEILFYDVKDHWKGHGTKVCGIIGAYGTSEIKGVLPSFPILNIKILPNPSGKNTHKIVCAMILAAAKGAKVINNSWSYYGQRLSGTKLLNKTIKWLEEEKNVYNVFAAGNKDGNILDWYPQKLENIITVGGINKEYNGRWHDSSSGKKVTVWAPGECIKTTAYGGGFVRDSGTSLAAPFVTAAVAIMIALNEDHKIELKDIKDKLMLKNIDLGLGYDAHCLDYESMFNINPKENESKEVSAQGTS